MIRLYLLGALALTACKQGEGGVCQVNADCEDGLVCNQQTAQCQRIGGGVDAIPIDAPQVDAEPEINNCTPSGAADMTGMAAVTLATWDDPHQQCLRVSTNTMVQWDGVFADHPLVGGEGGASPSEDANSPITMAAAAGTQAIITLDTAGVYPYYSTSEPTTMLGVIYVE